MDESKQRFEALGEAERQSEDDEGEGEEDDDDDSGGGGGGGNDVELEEVDDDDSGSGEVRSQLEVPVVYALLWLLDSAAFKIASLLSGNLALQLPKLQRL